MVHTRGFLGYPDNAKSRVGCLTPLGDSILRFPTKAFQNKPIAMMDQRNIDI